MSLLVYNPALVAADTSRLDLGTYIIASNVLTISAWVKYPQAGRTSDVIISTNGKGSTTNVIRLQCAERRAEMRVNSATGNANSELVGNDNQWTHVCGILNGSSYRAAFINGGGKGTNTGTQNSSSTTAGCIGGNNNTDSGFNGLIAEVAVWNSVLTDNDVFLLSKGLKPSHLKLSNLIYYAPMKIGDGNKIHFRSTKTQTYTFVGVGIKPRLCLDHPPMIERKNFTPLIGFLPATGDPERVLESNVTLDNATTSSILTSDIAATSSITLDTTTITSIGTLATALNSDIALDTTTVLSTVTLDTAFASNDTLANTALTSTATLPLDINYSSTLDNATTSSTLTIDTGALNLVSNVTLDNATISSTATIASALTYSTTLDSVTISSTATIPIVAAMPLEPLENATTSSTITNALVFSQSNTLEATTISSTFTIENGINLVSNVTLDDTTLTSTSTLSVSCISDVILSGSTTSSTLTSSIVAVSTETLGNTITSSSITSNIVGTSSITLDDTTLSSSTAIALSFNYSATLADTTIISTALTTSSPPFVINMTAKYNNVLSFGGEAPNVTTTARANGFINISSKVEV